MRGLSVCKKGRYVLQPVSELSQAQPNVTVEVDFSDLLGRGVTSSVYRAKIIPNDESASIAVAASFCRLPDNGLNRARYSPYPVMLTLDGNFHSLSAYPDTTLTLSIAPLHSMPPASDCLDRLLAMPHKKSMFYYTIFPAIAMASATAFLEKRGLKHNDLHLNNFLLKELRNGWSSAIIDLDYIQKLGEPGHSFGPMNHIPGSNAPEDCSNYDAFSLAYNLACWLVPSQSACKFLDEKLLELKKQFRANKDQDYGLAYKKYKIEFIRAIKDAVEINSFTDIDDSFYDKYKNSIFNLLVFDESDRGSIEDFVIELLQMAINYSKKKQQLHWLSMPVFQGNNIFGLAYFLDCYDIILQVDQCPEAVKKSNIYGILQDQMGSFDPNQHLLPPVSAFNEMQPANPGGLFNIHVEYKKFSQKADMDEQAFWHEILLYHEGNLWLGWSALQELSKDQRKEVESYVLENEDFLPLPKSMDAYLENCKFYSVFRKLDFIIKLTIIDNILQGNTLPVAHMSRSILGVLYFAACQDRFSTNPVLAELYETQSVFTVEMLVYASRFKEHPRLILALSQMLEDREASDLLFDAALCHKKIEVIQDGVNLQLYHSAHLENLYQKVHSNLRYRLQMLLVFPVLNIANYTRNIPMKIILDESWRGVIKTLQQQHFGEKDRCEQLIRHFEERKSREQALQRLRTPVFKQGFFSSQPATSSGKNVLPNGQVLRTNPFKKPFQTPVLVGPTTRAQPDTDEKNIKQRVSPSGM